MLEGDAFNLCRSIREETKNKSNNGDILKDIYLFSSQFKCFECKMVPRHCNRVADIMANYAKDCSLEMWVNHSLSS